MVTTPPPAAHTADVPAGNILERWIRGWDWFWFHPADPTLLGALRILTGMIVVWVQLAYTVDLDALLGPKGLLDVHTVNEFRHNWPWMTIPASWESDMEAYFAGLQSLKPPAAEQRAEIEQYVRTWDVDPRLASDKGFPVWSIFFHVTDRTWIRVIHFSILGVMVLFTIGFCTRVTSVLTWMGAMCYINRNQWGLFGMDTMTNIGLFYLMIGPSGAALSVDRLIARYRATREALRQRRPAPQLGAPPPMVSANLVLRLMQVHFCWIYFAAGTSKLLGTAWWSGTATWGTMANYEFCPMNVPLYMGFLQLLCEHRWLWELFMTGGVIFTLAMELCTPFLIWQRKWRWIVLTGVVLLHTGISLFMGLTAFSFMMGVLAASFVPLEDIERFRRWLARRATSLKLMYQQAGAARQLRAASLVKAFDTFDQVELQPHAPRRESGEKVPADAPLQLITPTGEVLTGFDLFTGLTRWLWLLRPLALVTWLPGVASMGQSRFPGVSPVLEEAATNGVKRQHPEVAAKAR